PQDSRMDPAVVLVLIAVLAVALAATGLLLSRRSQRRDRQGELAPSAEPSVTEAAAAPPVARAPSPPAPPLAPEPAPPAPDDEEGAAPRLRDRLGRTRGAFMRSLAAIRGRGSIDDATWTELEETLLLADVGLPTTELVLARLRERARADRIADAETLIGALRDELVAQLELTGERSLTLAPGERNVWMFVGVNGVGKTTTIAKVAQRAVDDGHQVVLAAGDTFRAAAAEQLGHWAGQVGVDIVRGQEGADPGSVVFDAMSAAESRAADLVLVDTAGRLHTKVNLMNELEKLKRIVDRTPGALKEMLLVLDATTGQNGLTQARQFTDAVGVTGVVLTKLDSSARGGIVLAIESELGIPVKLVGLGEGAADLVEFEPAGFVDALLS
ncbi:MAG: signal recognition particle-docking protein FtsY, partial [Acidimicrobiia bacterium]